MTTPVEHRNNVDTGDATQRSWLNSALGARMTPRAVYNKIAPSDLTAKAVDECWTQPLSLLLRSARLMRESLSDPDFPRRLSGLSFKEPKFHAAMDIFGDAILKDPNPRCAKTELEELAKIEGGDMKPNEKCAAVWGVISGHGTAGTSLFHPANQNILPKE